MKKGIGLYIGQKEVIAASLSLSKGAPVLDRFAIEAIPTGGSTTSPQANPSPTAETGKKKALLFQKKTEEKSKAPQALAIDKALEKIGGRRTNVVAAFNPFHLVARYFEMPYLPHREWESAAAYEAGRYLPFKLSEVIADFRVLESKDLKGNRVLSVTAIAARTELLRSYVNHIRGASTIVDMVEPIFSAFARALSMVETFEQGKTYGFLFLDSDGGVNITLARNGIVYLSRDFLLVEDRKGNETRFYEELKVSFDFTNRISGGNRIDQVYLAGSGDLVFWADFLTSVFGKEIHFEFGLFATKQDIPKNVLCALLVPIGLALRALKYKSSLGDFSLLPPSERETKPERVKRLVGVEFLIIALFFILVRIAILEPYTLYIRQQAAHQKDSQIIADPSLESLPVDQLNKMRSDFREQEQQVQLFSKRKISMSSKLKTLASAMPASLWLEQITYRSGSLREGSGQSIGRARLSSSQRTLTLQGQCYLANPEAEIKAINDWAKALSEDKKFLEGFQKVTVAEVRRDKYLDHDTSMFRIMIE